MDDLPKLVADAKILSAYALSNNIAVPDQVHLLVAGAKADEIQAAPGALAAFLDAFILLNTPVHTSANELRAVADRIARVAPQVDDAVTLLEFAAANARTVEDETRKLIVATAAEVKARRLTVDQEQAFMKAYQDLTKALAPITVETLGASSMLMPTLREQIDSLKTGSRKEWRLGRFINAFVFLLVLASTGIALAYFFVGTNALQRYKDMQDRQAVLYGQLTQVQNAYGTASVAHSAALAKAKDAAESKSLEENFKLVAEKYVRDKTFIVDEQIGLKEEIDAIPDRLGRWANQPCADDAFFISRLTLCSQVYRDEKRPVVSQADRVGEAEWVRKETALQNFASIEAARIVAARLTNVYLPLLLGFLGAHAFLLRRMAKDITERTFARGSAFNHLVRGGLGALAGLASTWLLTPEAVGGASLKSLPIWALAFVAGYGIELVFAFMDRIIAAFTQPQK
jgi:hypothetical protein